MTEASVSQYSGESIGDRIVTMRGQKVILDSDLAAIYGVEVRALNQQVKRNRGRFPDDFAFCLSAPEWDEVKCLRSQNVILKQGQHRKSLPLVFTEHGAIMAATVLNSPRAVQMSVFVVRAFVKMREVLTGRADLARKLAELEKKLTQRLDMQGHVISDIIQQIMLLLNPPPEPDPPRKQIGFSVRERRAKYQAKRQRAPA